MITIASVPLAHPEQILALAALQDPAEEHLFHAVLGQPGLDRLSTLASNAHLQSMDRTTITAACRSVRFSANRNTVTRPDNPATALEHPGLRTPR
ncbi:hypothetical protein [Streptomyces cucumeris]|uniref:hypothetical protein n=1 Tax=Streptomyces cucumeris TaxID=2962890 RepID=UPI003D70BDEB